MTNHEPDRTRRTFLRTLGVAAGGLAVGAGATGIGAANPGRPSFDDQIYAGGVAWGTKGAAAIPGPRNNRHSFDDLYFVVDGPNSPPIQLPVAEAAPGEKAFNGGRWISMTATVLNSTEYANRAPLKSASAVHRAVSDGVLSSFTLGAPTVNGEPFRPTYFECPLLPTK